MVERVLVQQVRLIDQEDRMNPLDRALFDVAIDGVAERGTELAVEVTATERGVVIVGEPKPGGRDAVAKCT